MAIKLTSTSANWLHIITGSNIRKYFQLNLSALFYDFYISVHLLVHYVWITLISPNMMNTFRWLLSHTRNNHRRGIPVNCNNAYTGFHHHFEWWLSYDEIDNIEMCNNNFSCSKRAPSTPWSKNTKSEIAYSLNRFGTESAKIVKTNWKQREKKYGCDHQ